MNKSDATDAAHEMTVNARACCFGWRSRGRHQGSVGSTFRGLGGVRLLVRQTHAVENVTSGIICHLSAGFRVRGSNGETKQRVETGICTKVCLHSAADNMGSRTIRRYRGTVLDDLVAQVE